MFFSNYSLRAKTLVIFLLIISPWLFVQAVIIVLAPDEEIKNMPSCDSNSGNCAYLGGVEDYRMDASLNTQFTQNSSTIAQLLNQYIEDVDGEILYQEQNNETYFFHFVEETVFWQFPDDIVVQISQSGDGCIIEMYSKSRLGMSDIGVNPQRLEKIHSHLSD
jgi:uncharacterized protein (DUF1499 family)